MIASQPGQDAIFSHLYGIISKAEQEAVMVREQDTIRIFALVAYPQLLSFYFCVRVHHEFYRELYLNYSKFQPKFPVKKEA